ncbi:class I SAM-dependent methyltransferase [Saliniramus sp.]|uniref:class I SAM-dependent methyltransferase n=1 Tax=Saliniramus sp. TaxID=2986772 RepID=UPI002C56E1CB|nr:class I SAM-dependent methyltransferase [Saliniramus sp.]HMB09906.1 class I SAM-dependent methyltransferase [Saliniramus sp.]
MTLASDMRFWDRAARKYAKAKIGDPVGYERTIKRVRALLAPHDRVLELGCGTGTTALRLAPGVQSYLATDISPKMIAIAEEKHAAGPIAWLSFRSETAQSLSESATPFTTVLGFNYLHLIRDLPGTLRHVHDLLAPQGLFISKTPCLGDMNILIRGALLPAMRAVGKAPHVTVFRADALSAQIQAAGFEILASEGHATRGRDTRPFIVARKR